MSLDDLDAIRVRWAAVTPGAWQWAHHGSHEVEASPNVLVADCGTEGHAKADAIAIAHAPSDIAALLERVEFLEAELVASAIETRDAYSTAYAELSTRAMTGTAEHAVAATLKWLDEAAKEAG